MTLLLGRRNKADPPRNEDVLVVPSRTWGGHWSLNNALQLATGLQVDAVLEAIDETAHVLVLVDACHSGFLAYPPIRRLPCLALSLLRGVEKM